MVDAKSVFHQHKVYLFYLGRFDCENTQNLRHQTRLYYVIQISWQQFVQEKIELPFGNSFNDEPIVVWKEKETTTPARAFTRLENHLSVETRVQWLVYCLKWQAGGFVQNFENFVTMKSNLYVTSNFFWVLVCEFNRVVLVLSDPPDHTGVQAVTKINLLIFSCFNLLLR